MKGYSGPVYDAHLHIVDPRFPLVSNEGYVPHAYLAADYLAAAKPLGIVGGAVVSGSFQAFDQDYLLAALAELGPAYVGVTQIPASTLDHEILALDAAGVRAVRFNVYRGGSESFASIASFGRRIHRLCGWHVELYADMAKLRPAEVDTLSKLPQLVVDHLGMSEGGLARLVDLAASGCQSEGDRVRTRARRSGRRDGEDRGRQFGLADVRVRPAVDTRAPAFRTGGHGADRRRAWRGTRTQGLPRQCRETLSACGGLRGGGGPCRRRGAEDRQRDAESDGQSSASRRAGPLRPAPTGPAQVPRTGPRVRHPDVGLPA